MTYIVSEILFKRPISTIQLQHLRSYSQAALPDELIAGWQLQMLAVLSEKNGGY